MPLTQFLRCSDVLLVRAAVLPFSAQHTRWPDLDDPGECSRWLAGIWAGDTFATAVAAASPLLGASVERIIDGGDVVEKRVRKATAAAARYLLRAAGRPTPFGLFAGVATATLGPATARIGAGHRSGARPDTLWLDHVRQDLQSRLDVLPCLSVQLNNLAVRHGDTLTLPLSGGRRATTSVTKPLEAVVTLTATPVTYQAVAERLAALGGTEAQITGMTKKALEAGFLTSNLAAPMTETDPLGHLLRILQPHTASLSAGTVELLRCLDEVHRILAEHNARAGAAGLRRAAGKCMRKISEQGRALLAVDLRLDAQVTVPASVLREAERAANALMHLTRNAGEKPSWAAYHTVFWERYGAGSLVPLRNAVDLAAGVGMPADFPMSLWQPPPVKPLPRDELLLERAWQAVHAGADEVELTDADLEELSSVGLRREPAVAPHVEMAVRVAAPTPHHVDRGEFTLAVRPAWSGGALTGRFAASLPASGLDETYRSLPTLVADALPAQLSFTPVHPHAENVARMPAVLPHVISVGEHRAPTDNVIGLDDLAVLSTSRRLHLVSLSRRRVVEPVVLHPLALEKQAPPLARFLARMGRGFATAWTKFDWGPLVGGLPHLPRVRYGRTVLSPALWLLRATDLPTGPFDAAWRDALHCWCETWRCPRWVELREDDRTLRLDLSEPLHQRLLHAHLSRDTHAELAEAPDEQDFGWIGHAHELILPLTSAQSPLPHPDLSAAPVVTNQMLPTPADPRQRWVQAKLFTHPAVMDQVLTRRVPGLLRALDSPGLWFVRYRTGQEEDHLRLRIAAQGPDEHAAAAAAFGDWAAHLQAEGLASRLVLDGYRPEFGRYGTGAALRAAEAVFVADSDTVRHALADLRDVDRRVPCALGMIDIVCGFLGEEHGIRWLASTPSHGPGLPAVTRGTRDHIRHSGSTAGFGEAAELRRSALASYREHLTDGQVGPVLESLLHMHHNRVMGPDRDAEAVCRHAARQACRARTERQVAR